MEAAAAGAVPSVGLAGGAGHLANYFVARLPIPVPILEQRLAMLRTQGIKLRNCASFGLPGHVRLGVLPPASQSALELAWRSIESTT